MNALDILRRNEDGTFSPKLDKGQRLLFVGRSGSGKSNAEVSFPNPKYVFDIDNRFKGAASALAWLGPEEFGRISFDYYNPKDGFEAIDNKLAAICADVESRRTPVSTIVFDSIGSLVYMLALDSQRKRGIKGEQGAFKGKIRGKVQFLHPDDYNYVYTAMRIFMFDYIMPLNEVGVNTIFSAWVIDKWGRRAGGGEFDPPEVVGEKIVGPGNFVEEVVGYFDEMYYFRREFSIPGLPPKFSVEFNGSFSKSALALPSGKFDITGKNFYEFWRQSVEDPTMKWMASK